MLADPEVELHLGAELDLDLDRGVVTQKGASDGLYRSEIHGSRLAEDAAVLPHDEREIGAHPAHSGDDHDHASPVVVDARGRDRRRSGPIKGEREGSSRDHQLPPIDERPELEHLRSSEGHAIGHLADAPLLLRWGSLV